MSTIRATMLHLRFSGERPHILLERVRPGQWRLPTVAIARYPQEAIASVIERLWRMLPRRQSDDNVIIVPFDDASGNMMLIVSQQCGDDVSFGTAFQWSPWPRYPRDLSIDEESLAALMQEDVQRLLNGNDPIPSPP